MPHAVPGVFAPKAVAAAAADGEVALVPCTVVGGAAILAEAVGEDEEAVNGVAVTGAVDAEARTLGQKVLLKACTSTWSTSALLTAARGLKPTLEVGDRACRLAQASSHRS